MIPGRGNNGLAPGKGMPNNPFVAKIEIKKASKKSNPFIAKVQINPFVAKAKGNKKATTHVKEKKQPNPFASAAKRNKQKQQAREQAELDQLRALILEAEHAYEESLTKAMRSGVNKQQVKSLFDISDRRMTALMNLNRQLKTKLNGHGRERHGSWRP